MGSFTGLDLLICGVLLISSLLGAWRGIVSEILALIAWIAAFFAARSWGGDATSLLSNWLSGLPAEGLRQMAGFLAVFILTLMAFALLRLLLTQLLRALGLGLTDRLLGTAFGFARGFMILWTAVLLAGLTHLPRQTWWQEARLAPPLETAVIASKPWLPAALAKNIHYRGNPTTKT